MGWRIKVLGVLLFSIKDEYFFFETFDKKIFFNQPNIL